MANTCADSRRRRSTRGFTVLEALVALAAVTLSLAAIGNLTHTTMRSELAAEASVSTLALVEALVNAPANRIGAAEATGRDGAREWRVTPVRTLPTSAAGWTPVVFSVAVRDSRGGQRAVEIIRLVRAPAR